MIYVSLAIVMIAIIIEKIYEHFCYLLVSSKNINVTASIFVRKKYNYI